MRLRTPRWPPRIAEDRPWHGDPALDLPPAELGQVLVIAATPRVSSTFYVTALRETHKAGWPTEYAHELQLVLSHRRTGSPTPTWEGRARQLRRRVAGDPHWELSARFTTDSVAAYLRHIAARRTSANGVFAIKLMRAQYEGTFVRHGLDLDVWGVPVCWVHLARRDRLAQAISLLIAHQTGRWMELESRREVTRYDDERIAVHLAEIEAWEAAWDRHLATVDGPVLDLWAEDVNADPMGAVRATLAMVGDELDEGAAPPEAAEFVSHDRELRAEWMARVLDERPDLAARRWAPGGGPEGERSGGELSGPAAPTPRPEVPAGDEVSG